MAEMFPPSVPDHYKSRAEIKIFDRLKTELGKDWYVLHSLGLTVHDKKPWAEIDFVLIGPDGIFCLEVKGGRVARKNGAWLFTNKAGRTNSKKEGPFEQVGSASAALFNHLKEKFPFVHDVICGYGVAFPDIVFNEVGADITQEVVYDIRNVGKGFYKYVLKLKDYWNDFFLKNHSSVKLSLSEQNRKDLLKYLRGDFDLRPPLGIQLQYAEENLIRLTEKQYEALNCLADNPRVLITGGAGTGKTFLAVQEACRHSQQGKKVFLTCFNRNLASFLKKALSADSNIFVCHLHGFLKATVEDASLQHDLPDAETDDLFQVFYPQLTLNALKNLNKLEEFDVLIVDEAQDLLVSTYMDVFDALVKNRLAKGVWRFFYDPNQNIFNGMGTNALQNLNKFLPAIYRLNVNCRNTRPIAFNTALLSGADMDDVLSTDGPEVITTYYRDVAEQRDMISNHIKTMLSEKLSPDDIVVLSYRQLNKSCLKNGLIDVPYQLRETNEPWKLVTDKYIRYATVGAFKGLEAKAIIIVDIDNLTAAYAQGLYYVASSRAKVHLSIFIAEGQKTKYEELAAKFGVKLAAASREASKVVNPLI